MKDRDLLLLGALGLGAVLLAKRRPAAAATPAPAPVPIEPGRVVVEVGPVVIEDTPAGGAGRPPVAPLPVEVARVGGAYQLEQGARYRARVELSGMEALLGNEAAVADRFRRVGFGGVSCRSLGGGAFELEGTWTGQTGSYPAPAQIVRVWRIG